MLTLEKWNSMSLSEQYELVFHPSKFVAGKQKSSVDPSRQKPVDVPYFIRLVTRQDT